jgi:hypothetical protein
VGSTSSTNSATPSGAQQPHPSTLAALLSASPRVLAFCVAVYFRVFSAARLRVSPCSRDRPPQTGRGRAWMGCMEEWWLVCMPACGGRTDLGSGGPDGTGSTGELTETVSQCQLTQPCLRHPLPPSPR